MADDGTPATPLLRRLLCTASLYGATAYFADRQRSGRHCLTCCRILDCADRKTIPELEDLA